MKVRRVDFDGFGATILVKLGLAALALAADHEQARAPDQEDRAEDEAGPAPRKRGPKTKKRDSVVTQMRAEIQSGEMTRQDLNRMLATPRAEHVSKC